jgi:hypothetical protein
MIQRMRTRWMRSAGHYDEMSNVDVIVQDQPSV